VGSGNIGGRARLSPAKGLLELEAGVEVIEIINRRHRHPLTC